MTLLLPLLLLEDRWMTLQLLRLQLAGCMTFWDDTMLTLKILPFAGYHPQHPSDFGRACSHTPFAASHMASSLHANQKLSLPLKQPEAVVFSASFKTRSILGSLVFGCSLGPFRRRKNQNPVLKKKACTATASGECAPDAKRVFIVLTDTDIHDVSGSSPTRSADRVAHAPASLPLQPCSAHPASHDCTTSQSSAAAVKTYAKRNSVILSDSSEDEGCSSSAPAVNEAAGMDGVERGQDEEDVDLLDPWLSSSESCDDVLSADDDFINDESSSTCSSPGRSPVLRERVSVTLQTKKKQLPPCHRCRKRDGDRFRCSECQHTFHEDCGGPGPSCTLCSGCAAALGVDPAQLSSSSSDESLSSSSDSGDGSSASSSGSSNAEYECAVCQENDCGYIRACRVCGVRAHESCGGPGPMHRKCDKYDASPFPPLSRCIVSVQLQPDLFSPHALSTSVVCRKAIRSFPSAAAPGCWNWGRTAPQIAVLLTMTQAAPTARRILTCARSAGKWMVIFEFAKDAIVFCMKFAEDLGRATSFATLAR
jgi:hypothetical protein